MERLSSSSRDRVTTDKDYSAAQKDKDFLLLWKIIERTHIEGLSNMTARQALHAIKTSAYPSWSAFQIAFEAIVRLLKAGKGGWSEGEISQALLNSIDQDSLRETANQYYAAKYETTDLPTYIDMLQEFSAVARNRARGIVEHLHTEGTPALTADVAPSHAPKHTTPGPKVWCSYHKTHTHATDDCNAIKGLIAEANTSKGDSKSPREAKQPGQQRSKRNKGRQGGKSRDAPAFSATEGVEPLFHAWPLLVDEHSVFLNTQTLLDKTILDNACGINIVTSTDAPGLAQLAPIDAQTAAPTITGVGGERLTATHSAQRGCLGTTLVVPQARVNLASLATILDHNPGAVFDGDSQTFTVYTDGSKTQELVMATRHEGSKLWILNDNQPAFVSGTIAWGASTVSQVSIPTSTGKHYSREQRLRAMRARIFHKFCGHPCDAALSKAVDNGLYINVPITSADLRAANDIFGPCPACLMGKMTSGPEVMESTLYPPANKPGQVLHMDKAKLLPERSIGGFTEHLVAICEHTGKVHAIPMKAGTQEDIEAAEEIIVAWYKRHGHNVELIVSDHENAFLAGQQSRNLRGIEFRATPPGLHEKVVERAIREIRDKCRTITADLPYVLPGQLYGELVNFVVMSMGDTPCAKSADSTPNQLCTGKKMVLSIFPLPWGTAVIAHDKVGADGGKPKQADRGVVGIFVGLSTTTYGAYRVFAPLHRGTVDRRKVTVLRAIPAEWGWPAKQKAIFNAPTHKNTLLPDMQPPQRLTYPGPTDYEDETSSYPETTSTVIPLSTPQLQLAFVPAPPPESVHAPSTQAELEDTLPPLESLTSSADSIEPDVSSSVVEPLEIAPDTQLIQPHDVVNQTEAHNEDIVSDTSSAPGSRRSTLRNRPRRNYKKMATEGLLADVNTEFEVSPKGSVQFAAFMAQQARVSVKEYLQGPHRLRGLEAMKAEVLNLQSNKVGTPCRYSDIPKDDRSNLLRTFMFLKDSFDSHTGSYKKTKARLVSDGSKQLQGTFGDNESHTLSPITLFLLLALTAYSDYELKTYDVPGAFLKSAFVSTNLEKQVYVLLDASVARIWCDLDPTASQFLSARGELILKLDKCLYGLKQSPKHWYDTLSERLLSLGYKRSPFDRCLFYKHKGQERLYVGFHVDDLITPGTRGSELRQELEDGLDSAFGKLTRGDGSNFTGFHIEHDRSKRTIRVSMPNYARSMLSRYTDLAHVPAYKTPGTTNFFAVSTDVSPVSAHDYLSKLMALMYYARFVCPELLPCICFLSSQSQAPTKGDLAKLHRLFGYVKSDPDRCITIHPLHLRVGASVDAAYGLHPGGESHTGIILTLGGAPIGYKSHKQKSISVSSTGAEVVALAEGIPLVLWARDLLHDLGITQTQPARIGQDNQSAITQTSKPCTFKRSKNLLIKLAWIREHVANGHVTMEYVPSTKLSADLLTKPIVGVSFHSKLRRFRGEDYIN
jgi:hypothetical protein